MKSWFFTTMAILVVLLACVDAGPATCGLCYTACNAGYVSCMAASGLFGAVGCSATQGICMAACAALFVAPTP